MYKALFTENYYRENWSRFIEKVPGEQYRNLEKELQARMAWMSHIPDGTKMDVTALETIKRIEAKKIADSCEALCRKNMQTLKDLEMGKASLGYTTHRQEHEARFNFRTRFEFNCLQLADFRKKYL